MSRRGTTTHNVSVHDQEVAELRRNRLTLFLQQFEKEGDYWKAKGSASAGNLRALTFLAARTPSRVARMPSRVARPVDPVKTKPVLRSVSSAGDLCSVAGCGPHVTLTTSQGQRFCLSEETKDDINLDLLDDVAMFQMQRLMRLMNYLSSKAKPHEES
ncbi:unnamed protein product [Lota lota]